MITCATLSCTTLVYELEASAQYYFVPEAVGSHKSAAIPAVSFVWPPGSACLGAAQSLWDGAVPRSLWELHSHLGGAAAAPWPWVFQPQRFLEHSQPGPLCCVSTRAGPRASVPCLWEADHWMIVTFYLSMMRSLSSFCLSFSCQHMTFLFHC